MITKNPLQKFTYKDTPYFAEKVFELIPNQLQILVNSTKGRQRDMLIFSIIVILSAYFPKVYGKYHGKKIYPYLFGIIGGGPASGKGVMLDAKLLGDKIHKSYTESYNQELKKYVSEYGRWKILKSGPKPTRPLINLFFIPANTSSAGLIKLLSILLRGIIVDSEVDTLSNILEQKFGDYSADLRKAFHHEAIYSYRKIENEYFAIENPCLALLLSGTPEQITNLIKSAENGLFSRIMFYVFDAEPEWLPPFLPEYIDRLKTIEEEGEKLKNLHFELLDGPEKEFRFTDAQKAKFDTILAPRVSEFHAMTGSEGVSLIMRLGLIFFRIAMVLTVIRQNKDEVLICDDKDFEATHLIFNVLMEHSLAVFTTLSSNDELQGSMLAAIDVLKLLPPEFETKQIIPPMKQKGFSRRGIFRILTRLCSVGLLEKVKLGSYRKLNIQN